MDRTVYLKSGSLLQGGRYRIEKFLGQGGFGITYLGLQRGLNRKVAIKEFFMKELCNRDTSTSQVSVGSEGSKDLVERFRKKFIKEAQTIAEMDNTHIIRIYDVFEENGTAYYVMEYLEGGDLKSRIPSDGLPVELSLEYIRQLGDALSYIHKKNILHLDIKPSNVLFREDSEIVLIDFGISKHYDETGGSQTSSTPVGISRGYAPLEQYKRGGVAQFTPSTDVYSIGATLYKLLTGINPPDAEDLQEDGLPPMPDKIPAHIKVAINKAMSPRRKDRPQSVEEFMELLGGGSKGDGSDRGKDVDDDTELGAKGKKKETPKSAPETPSSGPVKSQSARDKKQSTPWGMILGVIAGILLAVGVLYYFQTGRENGGDGGMEKEEAARIAMLLQRQKDSLEREQFVKDSMQKAQVLAAAKEAERGRQAELASEEEDRQAALEAERKVEASRKADQERKAEADIKAKEEAERKAKEKAAQEAREREAAESRKAETERISEVEAERKVEAEQSAKTEATRKAEEEARKAEQERQRQEAATSNGVHQGHEWVDLGLSVKWATCNVGASTPSDYGNYYAWGETSVKSKYTEKNSKTFGKNIGDISGNPSYDAARANWGGNWRLPTKAEMEELKAKCQWQLTTHNGHKGYRVTGPNGNTIFLPAAGWRFGSSLNKGGEYGNYWCSTPYGSGASRAYDLYFSSGLQIVDWSYRNLGQSVRPVLE